MGIRRRRKKLTTVLTAVDRRLRTVESRVVPTRIAASAITATEIAPDVIPPTDPKDSGATGATSSDTAPSEFAVVSAAAYSAKNITGSDDWIDITTAQAHGLSVGDKVTVYGLNNSGVNADGTYTITEVGSNTTFRYKVGLTGYYPSVVNLAVSATVTQRSCTLTEATLVLNSSTHGFVVGDVITVANVDAAYNGTFFVSYVDGATVKYKFITAASTAESITTSTGTVYSVVHKYAIVGDTWIDTSVEPNTIKIWDGLQWVSGSSLPDGVIIDDHMAPKPPTNLSAITSGYYNPTSGQPAVAVTLSWDAPTQNADNSTLTDLAGYKVFYRYMNQSVDGTDNGTVGFEPAGPTTIYGSPASSDAKVAGVFTWNNTFASTVPAISLDTDRGTLTVTAIAAVKGKKSVVWEVKGLADGDTFTVSWTSSSANKYGYGSVSGTIGSTTYTTVNNPATTGFSISAAIKATSQTKSSVSATPDITTDISSTNEVAPVIQWIGAGDTDQTSMSLRDFNVASTIEFAVQAYDSSKMNYSEYSDALSIETGNPAIILAAPSIPTMEARLGTLTVKWDGYDEDGAVPPPYLAYTEVHLGTTAGFTPSISTLKGRLERLGYNELVVANLTYGTTYYAKLIFVSTTGAATQASDASTGVTVVALVNGDITSDSLTTWPFSANTINVASLADGSIPATTLLSGSDAAGDAVRVEGKLTAGSIGAVAIAANAIIAGKIMAEAVTAREIKANTITADQIKAGALDAFLITGSNIQTAKPLAEGGQNARVVMNSGGITAYNTSGSSTFNIDASTGTVTIGSYDTSISTATTNASSALSKATTLETNVYYPGTTQINGGNIRTGTISADVITAGTMSGNRITGGTISGTTISGGSLSTSGSTNIEITGTSIYFNAGGTNRGSLYGTTNYSGQSGIIATTNLFAVLGNLGVYAGTLSIDGPLYSAGAGINVIGSNGGVYPTNGTQSTGFTVVQDGSGSIIRRYSASSRRYKNSESDIWDSPDMSPYKLLDIPVKVFKYNLDYLDSEDQNYDKFLPGLMAEDVDQYYPAASFNNEDGLVENWMDRSILVGTLALVQKLYETNEQLELRIAQLEGK